jgi:hypothetical protein
MKQNNLSVWAKWCCLLPVLLTLQACQQVPMANIKMMQAPEFEEANKYRTFTVRPFEGRGGAQFAKDLESTLAGNRVAGEAMTRTLAFAATPAAGSTTRSAGPVADAVISGEMVTMAVNDVPANRVDSECLEYGEKKILGIPIDCKRRHDVQRYCTKRNASLTVTTRVTDLKTQATVWGKTVGKQSEKTVCQHEDGKALPVAGSMLGEIYTLVLQDIKTALIPTEKTVQVKLIEKPDGLGAENVKLYEGALAFARENRMDRTCDIFNTLYEGNKQSVALTYGMGLCQESRGRLWEATDFYKIADGMSASPNTIVSEGLARVSTHVADINKVRGNLASTAPATATQSNSIKDQDISAEQKKSVKGEHRIALVMGNAKYKNIPALRNSAHDAQDMAAALKKNRFEVLTLVDGTRAQMAQAVKSFELKIRPNSTALIFYAGHGVQAKGVNYLIPVDARVSSDADLSTEAVDLDQSIMARLETKAPRLSIVILDACRNNPFPSSGRGGNQPGLATVNAPSGSIIAFSTAPNKTAEDGTGRNGLYTKFLLKEMQIPNRKIEDVFKKVRESVMKESESGQTPWENSALTGDFFFDVK